MPESKGRYDDIAAYSRRTIDEPLERRLRGMALGLTGAPGTVWTEGLNSVMAGARSALMPGSGNYDQEMDKIRSELEKSYPGTYSANPEVRNPAQRQAYAELLTEQGPGMVGSLKVPGRMYLGRKSALSDATMRRTALEDNPATPMPEIEAAQALVDKRLREFGNAFDEAGPQLDPDPAYRDALGLKPEDLNGLDPRQAPAQFMEDKALFHRAKLREEAIKKVAEQAARESASGAGLAALSDLGKNKPKPRPKPVGDPTVNIRPPPKP